MTHDECYTALRTHDRQYDGVFFICVKSTRIYCRSVCPARAVASDRCVFFETQAEAERAGFRPCLRCRPERAPSIAYKNASPVEKLANTMTDTIHLSDAAVRTHSHEFIKRFRVTPQQHLQTCRLLFAKQLLQETDLSLGHVASAVGYSGAPALQLTMEKAYRFAPDRLRARRGQRQKQPGIIELRLDYRPPLTWQPKTLQIAGYKVQVTSDIARCSLLITMPEEAYLHAHAILRSIAKFLED